MPQPQGQVVAFPFPEDQPTPFLLELPSPSTSAEFGWDEPCQEQPSASGCAQHSSRA